MPNKMNASVRLKHMSFFHEQCYFEGKWVDADDKAPHAETSLGLRRDPQVGPVVVLGEPS